MPLLKRQSRMQQHGTHGSLHGANYFTGWNGVPNYSVPIFPQFRPMGNFLNHSVPHHTPPPVGKHNNVPILFVFSYKSLIFFPCLSNYFSLWVRWGWSVLQKWLGTEMGMMNLN